MREGESLSRPGHAGFYRKFEMRANRRAAWVSMRVESSTSVGVGCPPAWRQWKGEDMARNTGKRWLAALAVAGIPLVTSATCDPQTGAFDFFRADNGGYYDGYYSDVYYVDTYDDCFFFDCW